MTRRALALAFTAALVAASSACSSSTTHDCSDYLGNSTWIPESTTTNYTAAGVVDITYPDGTITHVDSKTSGLVQPSVSEEQGVLYAFIYAPNQDPKNQAPGFLAAKILMPKAPPGQSSAITTAYACPYANDTLGYGSGEVSDTDLSCLGADGSSHPAQTVALSGSLTSHTTDSSDVVDADAVTSGTIVVNLHVAGQTTTSGGYCKSSGL